MIKIDDYSIVYSKKHNQVVIYLPALWTTFRTTFDKISNTRKEEVSNEELTQILMLAISIFEKRKAENEGKTN